MLVLLCRLPNDLEDCNLEALNGRAHRRYDSRRWGRGTCHYCTSGFVADVRIQDATSLSPTRKDK